LNFLDNGVHYLIGYIPPLLAKLQELYKSVESMPNSRFYASSLLVIYDGSPSETCGGSIDIKMVDFANCVSDADNFFGDGKSLVNFPPTKLGPDSGYLLGLKTLLRCFGEIYDELKDAIDYRVKDENDERIDGHVLIKSLTNTRRIGLRMGI
jgi:hypothetical protein